MTASDWQLALWFATPSAPPLTGDRPDDPYVGTLDVDLVVDPIGVPDEV